MTKAGIVKAKFPRRPQNGWRLKRITVEKTRTGKYYCCILYQYTVQRPAAAIPTPETTLGLKHSPLHFSVDDAGRMADPPRWLSQSQEKLGRIQKKLSRMEPGSKNYQEAVQKYRLIHERIANQRRDFIHKESRQIANAWDAVCLRDDPLDEMALGEGSGFGMFREMLRYKLERQGKPLILVDRYTPTTRTCSACGQALDSVPSRTWVCPGCGAVHDREVNAAKNIKSEGLAHLPTAGPA